jgi:hypothetical protein
MNHLVKKYIVINKSWQIDNKATFSEDVVTHTGDSEAIHSINEM